MVIINGRVVEGMERPQHLALCFNRQGKRPEEIASMLGLRVAAVKKTLGSKTLHKLFDDAMPTSSSQ